MGKILSQSKELRENHLTVIIRTKNQEDAECIEKEFRAMVRRIKHRTDIDVSYEMFMNIRKI